MELLETIVIAVLLPATLSAITTVLWMTQEKKSDFWMTRNSEYLDQDQAAYEARQKDTL